MMRGTIGRLASRRMGDRDRRLAFWTCAALLIVAAGVLFAVPDQAPPELEAPPAAPRATAPVRIEPAETDLAARRAARRFLAGYLALVSGRGSAESIPAASPALVTRLGSRLRIPPASRGRQSKIKRLEGRQIGAELVAVTAGISTAGISYSLALTVSRRRGRWVVVRVAEAR